MINTLITKYGQEIKNLKVKLPKITGQNFPVAKLQVDEFIHSGKAYKEFPDFVIKKELFNSFDEYREVLLSRRTIRHKKRMQLFASDLQNPPPRVVSKLEKEAIDMVQYEKGEYSNVMRKCRKGEPLNQKEQQFYDFILSSMQQTETPRTLWRFVAPFDGFEEQVRAGKIDFNGFSSTSSKYDDFFDFWESCDLKNVVGGKILTREGYMLKINVRKGTPFLDCNAVRKTLMGKTLYPRLDGEVVLPEGQGIIKNIDEDLKVIDVDFYMK